MKAFAVVILAALCCITNAEVSSDCLWGREDANPCCKSALEEDSARLANPKECSSFYVCKNNEPMLFPCIPGQVWDVEEQNCVTTDDVAHCEQLQ